MTHAVLYTPDDIAAHHDSNPMAPISRPQVDKGVILVMDDDDMIRRLFSAMLACLG